MFNHLLFSLLIISKSLQNSAKSVPLKTNFFVFPLASHKRFYIFLSRPFLLNYDRSDNYIKVVIKNHWKKPFIAVLRCGQN